MSRISNIYRLGKTQHELDFVDIDPERDFPVYLNPFVFSNRADPFSIEVSRVVSSFFQHNLGLMRAGETELARQNFSYLTEPNETCLGMSTGRPRGRGVGEENADDLFDSILNSEAFRTGLVDHLEDTAIFIDGIGRDKVSDMTTNIIRRSLIEYTQSQCILLGMPLTPGVSSGFFWNTTRSRWEQEHTDMLVVNNRKVLLVPKAVVSYVKEFNHGKYHQHYALEFLQDDHLRKNSSLVQTTYNKDGSIRRRFVTKKDIKETELPANKELLLDFTRRHPEVFRNFRQGIAGEVTSLPATEFASIDTNELIDHLIERLGEIGPGSQNASEYHNLIIGILEFIFYPNLLNPVKELEINQGRKRIDISFDNGAPDGGFFYRLQHAFNIPCPYIFIECKNYSRDVDNPVLDQMIGRFSPNRGKFGIITCRSIQDEELFMQRCSDAYRDQQGLVVPLTDADVIEILNQTRQGVAHHEDEILSNKARNIMA